MRPFKIHCILFTQYLDYLPLRGSHSLVASKRLLRLLHADAQRSKAEGGKLQSFPVTS